MSVFTTPRLVRRVLSMVAVAAVLVAATSCEWPEGTRYVYRVFDDVEVTEGIVYLSTTNHDGQPVDLKLDIYEPVGDTETDRPAVFWMFGGYWMSGDRDQLAAYAEDSALRGYVGVTIDYRIRPDGDDLIGAAWDAYEDAIAAAQWLREHAAEYGINPDAIIAGGFSAGAVNAMNVLYAPGDGHEPDATPVAGAVSIAGLSFVGPQPGDPPALMYHGTNDTTVPFATADDQCAAARETGLVCDMVPFDGEGHLIAFSHSAEIQADSAHRIYEHILLPLGYPLPGGLAATGS